jgi:hypothetical protein
MLGVTLTSAQAIANDQSSVQAPRAEALPRTAGAPVSQPTEAPAFVVSGHLRKA